MEPFIGQIMPFAGNFAIRGWALCNGQLLAIKSNEALFAILGTVYGGDGRTNFGLPDLRGRAPMHFGNGPGLSDRILGQKLGAEDNTLRTTQLPSHSHIAAVSNINVGVNLKVSSADATAQIPTAGASLVHGHQQIAYSNILPQHFFNNLRFRKRHNKSFSRYMLEENPSELLVKDYGELQLIVPYFMKRPLDMLLIVKDSNKRYLHQLNSIEQQQLVEGMQQAIQAILHLMEQMGIPPAYNMIINNGPGCGLYLEFLPKTQMMGGYEQIGLFVCQANAANSAELLRQHISLPKEK